MKTTMIFLLLSFLASSCGRDSLQRDGRGAVAYLDGERVEFRAVDPGQGEVLLGDSIPSGWSIHLTSEVRLLYGGSKAWSGGQAEEGAGGIWSFSGLLSPGFDGGPIQEPSVEVEGWAKP